jgi:cytochrome d ubiquinol oxidase subunit I
MSAFWIIVLNSWMHTPQGYEMRDGVAHAVDWWAIVFNPSMPYRLGHMLIASGLTVAFLIAGLSAWRLLRGDRAAEVGTGLRFGLTLGAVLIPVQIFLGDLHGLNTLEHQPAKVAAMEANWETRGNVPLVLFALPDEAARTNHFELAIPNGASLILKHHAEGVVPGLNDFVTAEGAVLHPPVAPVFWGFRVMVGTGLAMLALSWGAVALMWRRGGALGLPRPVLWATVGMTFSGWLATLAGWYVTEIGRQPWLVTGVLTTEAALGEVPPAMVASSLVAYLLVYAVLLAAYVGVLFYLARKGGQLPGLTPRPAPVAIPGE